MTGKEQGDGSSVSSEMAAMDPHQAMRVALEAGLIMTSKEAVAPKALIRSFLSVAIPIGLVVLFWNVLLRVIPVEYAREIVRWAGVLNPFTFNQ